MIYRASGYIEIKTTGTSTSSSSCAYMGKEQQEEYQIHKSRETAAQIPRLPPPVTFDLLLS